MVKIKFLFESKRFLKLRAILFLLFLSINGLSYATKYYVSTSGNNANDGLTTLTPWQTIQYAETKAINPGDIIALKKGDIWSSELALGIHHGGISGNPIIWDGALWGTGSNAILRSSTNRTGSNLSIVNITGCSYVTFQNIILDGNNTFAFGLVIGGTNGMYSPGGVQNLEKSITVQNCSVLNCGNGVTYALGLLVQTWKTGMSDITIKGNIFDGADDEQLAFYGGKSPDGGIPAECKNVYIGYNTLTNWGRRGQSTGYGLQINNKITNVVIEHNTLTTGPYGHGNGLHIESNEPIAGYFPSAVIVRYNKIYATADNTYCIYITQGQAKTVDVYYNLLYGGTHTTTGGGIWVLNSISPDWTGAKLNFYNNTIYTISGRSFTNGADAGVVTIKNNLFYNSGTDDYGMMCLVNNTSGTANHNNNLYYRSANINYTKIKDGSSYKQTDSQVLSWETDGKASDPLFTNPGSDYHLKSGSPAIGTGVAISGMTKDLDGIALPAIPDIGCYQSSVGTPVVLPVYVSSAVENTTPSVINMTYNLSLANILPGALAFIVQVNSVARTISSVAVSGTKVNLTLASAVVFSDIVTVSYIVPSSNQLQTLAGGQAASISSKSVTNNVSVSIPDYLSSILDATKPSLVEITYNLGLSNIVPAVSAFNLQGNSKIIPVNSIAIVGSKVLLTLSEPVVSGDNITLSYTKPVSNPLQSTSGGQVASSSNQVQINIITSVTPVTTSDVKMVIFPNPVHGVVNITFNSANGLIVQDATLSTAIIKIVDLRGKVVFQKILDSGTKSLQFPTNLKSGVYIAILVSGGITIASQKLIVTK
jgi:uncharacterized repeat protein (TIGR02059 family)